ncbi:hypothetical protein [Humibacter sp.]|uniref:hypothetical protein n=1 Tax=Humibacter sp. TaxID=1940291 RepID=UPI003F7E9ED3
MTRILTVVVSGAVGVGLGALSGRILFDGTAWNMIPWAIVAIAIGLVTDNRRTALLASGTYGYLLVAVFLYAANTGNTPVAQRILFALALGLVGPVCTIALTVITRLIRLGVQRHRPSDD